MTTTKTDIATLIGKGLIGAIPFVGPLAAEIIGATIPNQRIDRIERLMILLEEKLKDEDKEKVKEKMITPESVDLLEDGFIQTSRALTEERKDYIASLLKNSLTNDQVNHLEYKKLLLILQEVNDIEILLLKSYSLDRGDPGYDSFWKNHENVLIKEPPTNRSSQEEIDSYAVFQTYKSHLADLGLFRVRYKKPKKGEFPEFDEKTGMIKAQGYSMTNLGRLLLRSIDQLNVAS